MREPGEHFSKYNGGEKNNEKGWGGKSSKTETEAIN